jgi:hypothetical protein
MSKNNSQGQIITFYSYKGGTGRSMILANVAWVLASNGKRVLTIDWDLEAPPAGAFLGRCTARDGNQMGFLLARQLGRLSAPRALNEAAQAFFDEPLARALDGGKPGLEGGHDLFVCCVFGSQKQGPSARHCARRMFAAPDELAQIFCARP